ncbi:tetratricopeptide repeat protein 37-like [Xenia sp. Carnegie-2017]|uniref:tetratricopeptide repeat protein 37-like n=1 Tax=Xenia sp. Carnegie-2017 TaxID=2897299 RepID=UPI001F047A6B|nr:tetratricopeptide repeat protein 37-like [Xenia sp. Carnegie-2017]
MASKEVKKELKSAREAIQQKEFQNAIAHCKAALKLDKVNYNAFVFIGVASLELAKPEQAFFAYKKAINIDPENILAWQGMASLRDKEPGVIPNDEIPNIYGRLMKHYNAKDSKKWSEFALKLFEFHRSIKQIDKALNVLQIIQNHNVEDEKFVLCQSVDLLHENKENLTSAQLNELLALYKTLLHPGILDSKELQRYFLDYTRLLPKDDSITIKDTLVEAVRLKDVFGANELTLNFLAKLFLSQIDEFDPYEAEVYEELSCLCDESSSPLALLGAGKQKLFAKQYQNAEETLEKGLELLSTSSIGWCFYSQCLIGQHKYTEAVNSADKGLAILKDDPNAYRSDSISLSLSLCKARACSHLRKEDICTAIHILEELLGLDPENWEILITLGRIFVKNKDLDRAKELLVRASSVAKSFSWRYCLLEGEIYAAEEEFEKAVESYLLGVEHEEIASECYLNLGKIYWKMGEVWQTNKEKWLQFLLKAAKMDVFNPITFFYLGRYYEKDGVNDSKAMKCYKKAHSLNPCSDEIAEALVDVYMKLGLEDEAAEVCRKFTSKTNVYRVKWAVLRLGLYCLKKEDYNGAVHCFQDALRMDTNDSTTMECLGEAYMGRGSYNPALASFMRAVELNPSLLYSKYQIAALKHLLGVYDEAVVMYKCILTERSDYVPALKGLGTTYISYAKSSLLKDFHDRAVEHVQCAIFALARAIECDGHLSCLWKPLGDACSLVFNVHESKVRLDLPENLRTFLKLDKETTVTKKDIICLAASSFGQAVRFNSFCASLWHDVGLSNYKLSTMHKDTNERRKLCERSMKALKKALNMEPSNYIIWNTLGIVAASYDVYDPDLSQHSFIKSIQARKNPMAWTNLGVLYLRYGKANMANLAFNAAQCIDPTYTQAWIGQATIAEMYALPEAMDLYRHSSELGAHVEAYIGFSHWACQSLLLSKANETSRILKGKPYADLSHLTKKLGNIVIAASDALSKYTDQIHNNSCAYNMYGILLEHQRLYGQAEEAYKRSLGLLENNVTPNNDHCNIVRANYARVLSSLEKWSESIHTYQQITAMSDFYCVVRLALAYLKLGDLNQSCHAYEQAFQLSSNDSLKSNVKAALGMLGYMLGDIDVSKQVLFNSSQFQPASEHGLLAISVLGLITSDLTLAAAALTELVKIGEKGDENLVAEACYLFACFYAFQNTPKTGKTYIVKEIHRRPYSSLLWNVLAKFIIRYQPNQLKEAGRCAEAAHRLGDKNVEDVSTMLAYSNIGKRSGFSKEAVVSTQKALRMRPDCLVNWSLLSAALSNSTNETGGRFRKKATCKNITNFALTKAIQDANQTENDQRRLEKRNENFLQEHQKWLALQYGYCLYNSRKFQDTIEHCQQALEIWNKDSAFQSKIQLLLVQVNSHIVDVESCLQDIRIVLDFNAESSYAWMFSGLFHEESGLIKAAEFCYKNSLQVSSKKGYRHGQVCSLLRLAHLALRQAMIKDNPSHYIELVIEAVQETLNLVPNCSAANIMLGIAHYLQNHIRESKDVLCLADNDFVRSRCASVINFFSVLLNLKKPKKGENIEDIANNALCGNVGGSLQDILIYFIALSCKDLQRKQLLMKCIHINPKYNMAVTAFMVSFSVVLFLTCIILASIFYLVRKKRQSTNVVYKPMLRTPPLPMTSGLLRLKTDYNERFSMDYDDAQAVNRWSFRRQTDDSLADDLSEYEYTEQQSSSVPSNSSSDNIFLSNHEDFYNDILTSSSSTSNSPDINTRSCVLNFSIQYDYIQKSLNVVLVNLLWPPKQKNSSKGVLIVTQLFNSLENAESKDFNTPHKSELKPYSSNVIFNQQFKFESLQSDKLSDLSLRLSLCSYDRFSRVQSFGEFIVDLSDINIDELRPLVLKKNMLQINSSTETEEKDGGELSLSLRYQRGTKRISVIVLKATNLRKPRKFVTNDFYISIKLLHNDELVVKRKTRTRKGSFSACWNQPYAFDLEEDDLDNYMLIFTVKAKDIFASATKLGVVHIGAHAQSSGEEHWRESVCCKNNTMRQVTRTHKLF